MTVDDVTFADIVRALQRVPVKVLPEVHAFIVSRLAVEEETAESIAADDARWDVLFAATDDAKLQRWIDDSLAEPGVFGIDDSGDVLRPVEIKP